MPLKLMYITNRTDVARIAEAAGVDRIFVDLEYIGKDDRQAGLDTVKNHHTPEDVRRIKNCLTNAEVLARVNPIHQATEDYSSSKDEIDSVINAGADIVMLPFFKTREEVEQFITFVDGRAKTMLLFETPEAIDKIDEITSLKGIDEIHIGLNDLSLGLKKKFMFELLSDGTVEKACLKFKLKGIPYGFGGIGRLGLGDLPADYIIKEHYRLGSSFAILSRSFCNVNNVNENEIYDIFQEGVKAIRALEVECSIHQKYFSDNEKSVKDKVNSIVGMR